MGSQKLLIDEVLIKLNEGEIVYAYINKTLTFFAKHKELIQAKNANASYYLTSEDLKQLYENAVFYLYEDHNELDIDLAKDAEYYGWYHK